MKQFQLLCLLFLTLWVSNSMADEQATLIIPQALDIESINGDKYKGSLFSLGPKELSLDVGRHHIVVKYNTIWELDADNHERVTSELLHFSVELLAGKRYLIKLPALLELAEAENFIESPSLLLVDKKGGEQHTIKVSFQPPIMSESSTLNEEAAQQQALEKLRFWWSKASQSQREKFMAEVISSR